MSEMDHLSLNKPGARTARSLCGIAALLVLFLFGCSTSKSTPTKTLLEITGIFPAANAIPGWEFSQPGETFQHDNLFNLVDGQAESFFSYGFKQVGVQRYQDRAGNLLNAEIWQLATPADAYGLFTTGRTGVPAVIGNEGDSDAGRRLAFWQNRYFVSLNALQPIPNEILYAFAQAIAGKLPTGGERPVLIGRLPSTGLVEQTAIFFHEEMSIQMEVWLGGENILGLSQATNGVLGRYKLGDATVRLMLVEYPASSQAAKGLKALQSSSVADLVVSDVHGKLLGVVFGKVEAAQARTLLQEALK